MIDWQERNIYFQMGNFGAEIGQALKRKNTDNKKSESARDRALKLIDRTIADRKSSRYLKELTRIRQLFFRFLIGDNQYRQTRESWNRYFLLYSLAANRR